MRSRTLEQVSRVPLLLPDLPDRLGALKEMTGMSWERMAAEMGVDVRQLHRWRRGTVPNGHAMLALVRLATHVPGGLTALLDEQGSGRGREHRGAST